VNHAALAHLRAIVDAKTRPWFRVTLPEHHLPLEEEMRRAVDSLGRLASHIVLLDDATIEILKPRIP
jgi:hypothetical protein